MERNSNETKDIAYDNGIALKKLKVKNFIFPAKTLWGALRPSNNK